MNVLAIDVGRTRAKFLATRQKERREFQSGARRSSKLKISQKKSFIRTLTQRPGWKALIAHHQKIRNATLRELFAADPKRGQRLRAESVGLFLDYSKNRITDQTLKLLLQLARESGLRSRIDAMFSGEKINITENRAVLHVALRAPRS